MSRHAEARAILPIIVRLPAVLPAALPSPTAAFPLDITTGLKPVSGDDAPAPPLLVSDLKLPPCPGAAGLRIGPGTVAHLADFRVTVARP